jgi:hypothetical protein
VCGGLQEVVTGSAIISRISLPSSHNYSHIFMRARARVHACVHLAVNSLFVHCACLLASLQLFNSPYAQPLRPFFLVWPSHCVLLLGLAQPLRLFVLVWPSHCVFSSWFGPATASFFLGLCPLANSLSAFAHYVCLLLSFQLVDRRLLDQCEVRTRRPTAGQEGLPQAYRRY